MRRVVVVALLVAALALPTGAVAVGAILHRGWVAPSYGTDGLLVLLVIGSDVGPPTRPGNLMNGRSDAIHIVAVDPRAKRATIVDIPRDSWIAQAKVNDHMRIGGPPRLEGVLEAYTGIDIDFWILTSFLGLEQMVDGLGGIDVVVDQPMSDPFSGSNFAPGPQRMDGRQALAFTRDRQSVRGGDLGRTRHQGDLLRFAHIQVRAHHADLASLVRLVALLRRTTVSNIPAGDLPLLASLAVEIDPAAVLQVPLGGRPGMVGLQSTIALQPGGTFERIRQGVVGP